MPSSPSFLIQSSLFIAGLALGVTATSLSSSTSLGRKNAPQSAASSSSGGALVPASAPSGGITPVPVPVQGGVNQNPVNQVFRYSNGLPGPTPDILKRTAYVAAYDRKNKHPSWTAEHLTAASLARPSPASSPSPSSSGSGTPVQTQTKGDRSKSVFIEDSDVPEMFRASLKDYFRSGYDRGHMVPAADAKSSQIAMNETFLLSNIAPQVGDGFNRHYWAFLEQFVRDLTGRYRDVYCFTVPLYLPAQSPVDGKWRVTHEVIGNPPSISVPTHFAKVVLVSNPSPSASNASRALTITTSQESIAIGAFVLPNAVIPDETPLTTFVVPIESIERSAGLTLFSPQTKSSAKRLCQETKCELVVRRFDDARKGGQKKVEKK